MKRKESLSKEQETQFCGWLVLQEVGKISQQI